MARPKQQFPPLRWLKACNKWGVYQGRKRLPLHVDRATAETMRLQRLTGAPPNPSAFLTLGVALESYQRFAVVRYRSQPRTIARIKRAVCAALAAHGQTPADKFRGRALRDVRERLLTERPTLSRRYINHLIQSLKTAFTWLAAEEMVSAETLLALRAVRAISAGQGGAEIPLPPPADPGAVLAALPYLSPTVAAMVRTQQLTGMRPGELCRMRRRNVSTSADQPLTVPGASRSVAAIAACGELIWLYVPERHKNSHRGKPRVVSIGPEAQAILAPILMRREPDDFLFRPADDLGERPGRCCRPGPCYSAGSYSRAVARGIRRAKCQPWTVYGLRRLAGERADSAVNPDASGAMLGQSASHRALDSYLQLQVEKAALVAAKCG